MNVYNIFVSIKFLIKFGHGRRLNVNHFSIGSVNSHRLRPRIVPLYHGTIRHSCLFDSVRFELFGGLSVVILPLNRVW